MTAEQLTVRGWRSVDWPIDVPDEAFAPRELEQRYRVYAGEESSPRLGRLRLLATAPDAASLGVCLVALAEEGTIDRDTRVGVLDACPGGEPSEKGSWVLNPFAAGRTRREERWD